MAENKIRLILPTPLGARLSLAAGQPDQGIGLNAGDTSKASRLVPTGVRLVHATADTAQDFDQASALILRECHVRYGDEPDVFRPITDHSLCRAASIADDVSIRDAVKDDGLMSFWP